MSDLRERKRRRTMAHVQSVALDLFDERGFDTVTIEEIAERAEVSPSTIYRQFRTKEGIIIHDEWDEEGVAVLEEMFSKDDPMAEIGMYLSFIVEHMAEDGETRAFRRMRWAVTHPGVRRVGYGYLDELSRIIAEILVERRGLPPIQANAGAHAMVFGVWAALEHWYVDGPDRPAGEVLVEVVQFLGESFGRMLTQRG